MDTNKTYIKMCEKAEEIQAIRPLNPKQFTLHLGTQGIITRLASFYYVYNYKNREHKVWWLPRQDQLQDMVKRGVKKFFPYNLLWRFYRAISSNAKDNIYKPEFTSMEQLWLAFVMKEKYNKIWNGEEWIKS